MLGANHFECLWASVSWTIDFPPPSMEGGWSRLDGQECDLYCAVAGFTCLLILLLQPHWVSPSPHPSNERKSRRRDTTDTVQVHKAVCVHDVWRIQAPLMIDALPWEQSGSPAALQPGVRASPCECNLAIFSQPWNQAMGAWRKDWVSFLGFIFLIFSYEPTQFCNTAKWRLCLFFCVCVLLREGTERAGWDKTMEIRVEWRSVKNKKVEVVKSRTRLGREKYFYVFWYCLIVVLRLHQIPTQ